MRPTLLDGGPRSATVLSETPLVTFVVPVWGFRTLLKAQPALAVKMLEEVCRRLRGADTSLHHRVGSFAGYDAAARARSARIAQPLWSKKAAASSAALVASSPSSAMAMSRRHRARSQGVPRSSHRWAASR